MLILPLAKFRTHWSDFRGGITRECRQSLRLTVLGDSDWIGADQAARRRRVRMLRWDPPGHPAKRAGTSPVHLFAHTKHSQKSGPFPVARLEMDLPFHKRLAYNRVHKRSASPLTPPRMWEIRCQSSCTSLPRWSFAPGSSISIAVSGQNAPATPPHRARETPW